MGFGSSHWSFSFFYVTIDVISSTKVSIEGYVVVEDDSTKKSFLWILGSEFWLSQTSKICFWYCIFPRFKLFFCKTTGLLSLSKLSIDFFTWGVFHWEAVFVSLRWNAISLKLLVFVFDLRRYLYSFFSLRRSLISWSMSQSQHFSLCRRIGLTISKVCSLHQNPDVRNFQKGAVGFDPSPWSISFFSFVIDLICSITVWIGGFTVLQDNSTKKSYLWILGWEFW